MTARKTAAGKDPGARPTSLTFVTGNAGKLAELQGLLAPLGITVVQDNRGYPEIQAAALADVCEAGADHLLAGGLVAPFLLEDSGLFVAALRGFPGAYSRHALDTIGCGGILDLLARAESEMRGAHFETDLLYVDPAGKRHHFIGRVVGNIAYQARGDLGFGFDPIFVPRGETRTFGQMSREEKSQLSHRGQAVGQLAAHLMQTAKP